MSRLALKLSLGFVFFVLTSAATLHAQANSYTQTNLVSDTPGLAKVTDPNLVNPWGISFFPGSTFWIADNNSGLSTLYDAQGNIQTLIVKIPAPNGVAGISAPTGTVANGTTGFPVTSGGTTGPSLFIFDTEDGTISGWNGNGTNAALAVDNSMGGAGAVYKGLALLTNGANTYLLAANFRAPALEVYDANFKLTQLAGAFQDPTLPAGFAPFGVHVIGTQVVVTYAKQDTPKHDPVNAPGNGFVSLFDNTGVFIRRITSNGNLNSPWGAVVAPAGFGAFGGDLLIGNFGDGAINAFDMTSGNLIGQLKDANGQAIVNGSLWDLVFGAGGTGDPNTLFFTAGLANEQHGLFATLTANTTPPPATADFSIVASPTTATVSVGQSAQLTVTVDSLNGFSAATTFSCSGLPALATCSFSPSSVTPQAGTTATTKLTIATQPVGYMPQVAHGIGLILWSPFAALGLFGLVVARTGRKRSFSGGGLMAFATPLAFATVVAAVLILGGCGSYSAATQTGTPPGTKTVMVTATSGPLSHSSAVTLTVQ
jgi:uncharacterized protein (TIGR03118 family)